MKMFSFYQKLTYYDILDSIHADEKGGDQFPVLVPSPPSFYLYIVFTYPLFADNTPSAAPSLKTLIKVLMTMRWDVA
jgi:hypothetical protein